MRKFGRLLALVLIMSMLTSMLPVITHAEELETFTVGEYKEEVGVPRGKGENLFTFTPTESGTYALTVYTWTGTLLSLWVSDETQTIANYYQEFDDEFCRGSCVFEAEAGKIYTFGAGGTHISEGETFPVDLRLDEAVAPTDVELSNSQITGSVGDEFDLTMRFDPLWSIPEDYTWSVDNTSVATIDADGHLTLLKGGNTTVRLTTASGMSAQCSVRVTIPTSVKFDYETKTGYVGVKDYIDYTFEPYGASDVVTITSSDPSVVEVTYEEGPDEWYMEHLAAGTATLTITTDGGLTDTCIVNVMAEMDTIELDEAVTVTVQPGDEIRFAFAVPETDEYCVYTEEEEGALGVVGEMYYNHGSVNYELTQSDEEQVFIRNEGSVAKTYTLCVKKTVPVERVEIEGQTTLVIGDSVSLEAKSYPIWATYEDWTWTCSDSSAVTLDSSGKYGYVKAVAEGTAEITVTMSGGTTDTVTVTVTDPLTEPEPDIYEEIFCGDSKTITLDYQETQYFAFTPEEDGKYVFYMPNDRSLGCSIWQDGVYVGQDASNSQYWGCSCEMTGGNTYMLKVANDYGEEEVIRTIVTLDKLTLPDSISFDDLWLPTTLQEGDTFNLVLVEPAGTTFLAGTTWSVSDESVVTLNYGWANGADFRANAVGTATITATLENGVSASITIEVEELDYTCGENATWSYDEATGTLTISGEGAMYDYDWETYPGFPWDNMSYQISNIVIEEGITHIGDQAFYRINSGLSYVYIADSVTSIGSLAFSGGFMDASEWSVELSENVTEIGFCAFTGPVKVSVSDDNPNYSSDDAGCLYDKDQTKLLHVPSTLVGKFTVPDTVETIGQYAFRCCSLSEIELPDSVKTIEYNAFSICRALTEIEIPASVETLGGYAFEGCSSLAGIWVDEDNPNYASDSCGVLFNKDMTELIMAPGGITGSYTVPTTATYIQYSAFSSCEKLTEIVLLNGITEIDSYAFGFCDNLEKITFQGDAPAINGDAFYSVIATAYYPAGNKTWTEDVMQNYGGTITWVPSYEILEGADSIVAANSDSGTSIRIDGEYSEFAGVLVDNVEVDPSNYTVTEGSTIVTFDPDYLNTLSVGEHSVIIQFTNGIAMTTLRIVDLISGDINGDGKVNGKDGVLLAQYLAEWNVAINMDAADVNGDGKVNGKDGVLLAQYLAEWDVTLG